MRTEQRIVSTNPNYRGLLSANGPMENAAGFLFIPAPIRRGSQDGVNPPSTPKLTQLGWGGRQVDLGGGGTEESPGGSGWAPAKEGEGSARLSMKPSSPTVS